MMRRIPTTSAFGPRVRFAVWNAAISCLIFFLGASRLHAQSDGPAMLQEAVEAYAASDWKTAIEKFEKLNERNVGDPGLDYNLGTAYAQAGNHGRAVLHLLRAWRRQPRNTDIRHNLEIVAPDIRSQVSVFPIPPLEWLHRRFAMNEWALLAAIATALGCLLLAINYGNPRIAARIPIMKRIAAITITVAAVSHFFAAMHYYDEVYTPQGVVIGAETYPHPAPSETSTPFEWTLPAGTVIRIGHSGVNGWVKATYGGGNEVFIRESEMQRL